MLKFKIHNLEGFLEVVNSCRGPVDLYGPGKREGDLRGNRVVQRELWDVFRANRGEVEVWLYVTDPKDYLSVVHFYTAENWWRSGSESA